MHWPPLTSNELSQSRGRCDGFATDQPAKVRELLGTGEPVAALRR